MKTLIYCTKGKPRLSVVHDDENGKTYYYLDSNWGKELNGKVVASFDFDRWDLIKPAMNIFNEGLNDINIYKRGEEWVLPIDESDCLSKTCLSKKEIIEYSKGKIVYAYHIDNLQVFDEPVELGELSKKTDYNDSYFLTPLTKAPQSYMYVYYKGEKCLLLSVKSEWVHKILNGEKTVEIRKSVSKGVK